MCNIGHEKQGISRVEIVDGAADRNGDRASIDHEVLAGPRRMGIGFLHCMRRS
jgi:hypothetical protein